MSISLNLRLRRMFVVTNQIIFFRQVEKLKLANTEVTAEQVSFLCDELQGSGLNQNQVL